MQPNTKDRISKSDRGMGWAEFSLRHSLRAGLFHLTFPFTKWGEGWIVEMATKYQLNKGAF